VLRILNENTLCKKPLEYVCEDMAADIPPGLFLEFGVWTGGTLKYMARKHPERKVYGFDVFYKGLPEQVSEGTYTYI
jgi:hypothetical protein